MKKSLVATTLMGGASWIALSGLPAMALAQGSDQPPPPKPAAAAKPANEPVKPKDGELVVTGSRIRHTTFNSPAPISVITTSQAKDEGLLTATQMLQKSTAAAGSVQLNEQFGGFVVNGGPGVDTVSLRGLGDQRTLVLLNGRRLNPAGVEGTVAAVDLNVIPDSIVDRYEILKDGSSAVYGSDAIGGVVNIITKTNLHGLEIEADGYIPQQGAGSAYAISVDGGIVQDKYHVMFSVQYVDQSRVTQGDLPGGQCPLELQALPGSHTYNFGRSYADGSPYCAFQQTNFVGNLDTGATWVFDGSQPASFPYVPFQQDPFGANPRVTNIATESRNTGIDAFSPSRRTSGFVSGGVDLTPTTEMYFEGLITNRKSSDTYEAEFFPADVPTIIAASFSPFNPFPDYVQPVLTLPLQKATVNVTAGRALLGFDGDLFKVPDWKWDFGVTYGQSDGSYTIHPQLVSKLDNALDVTPVASNFDPAISRVNPVDGLRYTCAINLTNPNERCYPLNWFESSQQLTSDPALKYISSTDTGHTDFKQVVVDGHIDGPLFNLPAGPVQGVLGAEFRYDALNDTPGPEALANDYFNFTSAGITKGDENVTEAYGEVEVPVLKGLPMFESLVLNGQARFSHHSLAGDHWTFKGSGNWQLVSWLRLRGTYGTSFRGPELYENYLASLIGFTSAPDPCQMYGANAAPTSNLYKNCASEGLAPNFIGYGATPEDIQEGAQGRLKPETSKNLTLGVILQPSFADLQVSLDYYHIEIDNEISQLGAANILNLCYDSAQFRSGSPYCTLVAARDLNNNIATIDDRFLNIAQEKTSGLDLEAQYRKELSFGRVTLHGEATYQLHHTQTLFPGADPIDFLGTFGYPQMVFNTDARLKRGNWEFTWAMTFLGHQQEYTLTGETPGGRYNLDQTAQLFHTLSVSYTADKWRIEFGVRDITNEYSPVISNNPDAAYAPRIGEFANGNGNLELFGRTFFLNLNKKF
jgi:iron complex outermembrane recepter protein